MKGMKKILIVDDQREVRELVEVTLRVEEYEIIQAQNGREAVDMVRTERPDLVIMDVMMPGDIDGLEATRILKSDPETSDTIISVEGHDINNGSDISRYIQLNLGSEITMTVLHADDTTETVELTPRWRPPARLGTSRRPRGTPRAP